MWHDRLRPARIKAALRARADRQLSRMGRAGGVLMYHRVAEEAFDPWDLCVTPGNFAEQLDALTTGAQTVDLAKLAEGPGPGPSGRPRTAVTFDDGYRDNLDAALPVLERFGVPATIFIVSGTVGSGREYWWDALERFILRPAALPAELELAIAGEIRRWAVNAGPPDQGWRADSSTPQNPRQTLFLELWSLLVRLDAAERQDLLDQLAGWARVVEPPAPDRLPMDANELAKLAGHPLITIGCHTVAHVSLPDHAPAVQRRQIAGGQRELEDMLGRRVTRFAFPYGRFDVSAARIVRELKFDLACTSRPGTVTPFTERHALPRIQVFDGGGDRFAEQVRGWLPGFAS